MKPAAIIQSFTERYPLIGPAVWILSLQYFVAQIFVGRAWPVPYNIFQYAISDLGNTACGIYAERYVCSPLHSLMNASFILLGITMFCGSLLIYLEFTRSRATLIGFSSMAIAGFGTVLVGLFPENVVPPLHALGAVLAFLVGSFGIFVLGLSLDIPRGFKQYTVISALVSLAALALFTLRIYLGLDFGGMERVVSYPQTIWLIVFGAYISRDHMTVQKTGFCRGHHKRSK